MIVDAWFPISLKIPPHCFITSPISSNVLLTLAILLLSSSSVFSISSVIFLLRLRSSLEHWSNWVSGPTYPDDLWEILQLARGNLKIGLVLSVYKLRPVAESSNVASVSHSVKSSWPPTEYLNWLCRLTLMNSISRVRRVDRITNSSYCRTISPDILANNIKVKTVLLPPLFLPQSTAFLNRVLIFLSLANILSFVMTVSWISWFGYFSESSSLG